jgi:hypothetical protein
VCFSFLFIGGEYLIYQTKNEGSIDLSLSPRMFSIGYHLELKDTCEGGTQHVVGELEQHFPKHDVMIALGVVYPQFALQIYKM